MLGVDLVVMVGLSFSDNLAERKFTWTFSQQGLIGRNIEIILNRQKGIIWKLSIPEDVDNYSFVLTNRVDNKVIQIKMERLTECKFGCAWF